MSAAKVVARPVIEPIEAIVNELRGMAGELFARYDVAHGRMSARDAAFVLLARADEVEGLS